MLRVILRFRRIQSLAIQSLGLLFLKMCLEASQPLEEIVLQVLRRRLLVAGDFSAVFVWLQLLDRINAFLHHIIAKLVIDESDKNTVLKVCFVFFAKDF